MQFLKQYFMWYVFVCVYLVYVCVHVQECITGPLLTCAVDSFTIIIILSMRVHVHVYSVLTPAGPMKAIDLCTA